MAGEIEIRADLKGTREAIQRLRRIGADVDGIKKRAAEAGGEVIRADANRNAPGPHIVMDTKVKGSRVQVEIGPDEEHWYYLFFETGAVEHGIKPKNRKLLRFFDDDQEIFARVVQHPGMPADPYLRPALDERAGQAVEAVGRVIRRALPR